MILRTTNKLAKNGTNISFLIVKQPELLLTKRLSSNRSCAIWRTIAIGLTDSFVIGNNGGVK